MALDFSFREMLTVLGLPANGLPATLLERCPEGFVHDTRMPVKDRVFVALEGATDGHRYLGAALAQGALAALVARTDASIALPQIVVANPRSALLELAAWYRRKLLITVIGVTGSTGKTTMKRLLAAAIGSGYRTYASPGSYNNDLGLPLTLLNLPENTDVAVLELGSNAPGEIAALTAIARPDYGVITLVGSSHLAGFGSLAGVAAEKLDLFRGLPATGVGFANADCAALPAGRVLPPNRLRTFAVDSPAKVRATDVQFISGEGCRLHLTRNDLVIPLEGPHIPLMVTGAWAVGLELGLSPKRMAEALAEVQPEGDRMRLLTLSDRRVIVDCWNANPDSMASALTYLSGTPATWGPRVAVVGDMLELGAATEAAHEDLGRRVAAANCERVVYVGANYAIFTEALRAAGYRGACEVFTKVDEALATLRGDSFAGRVTLVKASHGVHLERLLDLVAPGGAQ